MLARDDGFEFDEDLGDDAPDLEDLLEDEALPAVEEDLAADDATEAVGADDAGDAAEEKPSGA